MRNAHYVTPAEARRFYGVARGTVYRWIRKGLLPATRTPGGRYRIAAKDLVLSLGPAHGKRRCGHHGGAR